MLIVYLEAERKANETKKHYNYKMQEMRRDMEDVRKKKIKEIEEKKNLMIKELTKKHTTKYLAIKNYYNEITNTNLDLLKQLKEDVIDQKTKLDDDMKLLYEAEAERKRSYEPLKDAYKTVQE